MSVTVAKRLDVLFKGATVVDGAGNPSFMGDVGVRADRIELVAPAGMAQCEAELEVDCKGLVLCPGFIDIHNHSDVAIFDNPSADNYVYQGVTTVVVGNCGVSAAPRCPHEEGNEFSCTVDVDIQRRWDSFAGYLETLDELPKAINVASLVGHGQIRRKVVGEDDKSPSEQEMKAMKRLVEEAMEAGAFGLSTGLIYSPGMYATTSEITELAALVAKYGGIYATHLRSEADLEIDAVAEAIDVGRASGCRVQVAHLKASARRNWGLVRLALDIMEYARRLGIEVTCDVYPYTVSGAGMFHLFPGWARSGGKAALMNRLRDPVAKQRIRTELLRPSLQWENILFDAGFDGLLITRSEIFPEFQGKTLAQVAKMREETPMDTLFSLAEADLDMGMAAGGMSEEDLRYALRHRLSMVCSDGSVVRFGEGCPHPRNYTAFTRAIATYARDESVLTLEDAIYKMTGFPAWKLGLADRGVIRPGSRADIAVFDYWRLANRADFGDPHHYSQGMIHVMVNGKFVLKDERPTGMRPGKALRRQ